MMQFIRQERIFTSRKYHYFLSVVYLYRFNFNDDVYNFIYGVVDELWKNVLKVVSQRTLDERKIHLISRCNINAIFRLIKVKLVL
jgi:hypothetical protein